MKRKTFIRWPSNSLMFGMRIRWIALTLTAGLVGACGGDARLTPLNAQPKTPVQRNHTTFYPALQCMDDLFVKAKRRPIIISSNQIPDKTKSVYVGTRGMIVTALNHMTRKSRAFIFVEQGLLGRTVGDTLTLEKDNRKHVQPPVPRLYVNGSISQVDKTPRSTTVRVGSANSSSSNGAISSADGDFGSSHSVVSLDLHLVRFPSRIVVPGSAISNSMVVSRKGWGAGFGGKISQRTLGITLNIDRVESSGQAVRNLIELGLIEMLGNYTGVPFWECLSLPQTDAQKTHKIEKEHLRQDHSPARLRTAQNQLNALGYRQVRPTGSMDAQTRKALALFQAKQGILANGRFDFDTFAALEKAHAEAFPKPVAVPKPKQRVRKPSAVSAPLRKKSPDDGYQSIQIFVDKAF